MPASDRVAERIAIVLHDFPAGGTERIAIRLAGLWAARGRSVTILCGSERGPARALVAPAVAVVATDPECPRGPGSRRHLGHALAPLVGNGRFDIVVGPGNFHIPVLHALAARLGPRRPCFVCKLSNPLVRPATGPCERTLVAAVTRHALRRVDALVAMSHNLRDDALRVLPGRDIAVLDEPILIDGAAQRAHPRPHGHPPTILCAGRMVPQKNFALALRAFARLGRPEARLMLCGDGPRRAALERLAIRLGIGHRIRWTGHVPSLDAAFREADLFLLTSAYEGYPAVLIEAIAAGLPIVTTRSSSAIDEILSDPSLGAVADATADALAQTIRRQLNRPPPDPKAIGALIERHDALRAADKWLARLDQIVRSQV